MKANDLIWHVHRLFPDAFQVAIDFKDHGKKEKLDCGRHRKGDKFVAGLVKFNSNRLRLWSSSMTLSANFGSRLMRDSRYL